MMGKKVEIPDIERALNQFLADEQHLVLGFEKGKEGIAHRVFKGGLAGLSLFNPFFGVNGALFFRRMFSKGAKLLLLLRPCEIRACTELVKLTQMEQESILLVSVDCFGALSSTDQTETDGIPAEIDALRSYLSASGKVRPACTACREPRGVVGNAGIRVDESGKLSAASYDERGEEFLNLFAGVSVDIEPTMLIAARKPDKPFETDMDVFSKDFSKCIMCMNCRDMCPVCYCIDCVFNGDDYLPKGDALLNKVLRGGITALPQGKDLYHFIRMFHVSQTCVGCGACEEACPQGIPLTKYFKGTSERLQGMFSYMSGRKVDEPIPYLTFLEDELKDADD